MKVTDIEIPIMKNVSGWDELPDHVKQEFENSFFHSPKTIKLLNEAAQQKKSGNFVIAMNIYVRLEKAWMNAQYDLLHNEKQEVEEVTLLQMGLSDKDINEINTLTIALYLACDMIEFFTTDINCILRKNDKTARFKMFDPIRKVGKEARANIEYLCKNTSMFDTEVFNNNSDDMRKMLVNKAKKVYREYCKRTTDKKRNKEITD